MRSRSWIDDEPSVFASMRQAAAIFIAGLRRPLLSATCAVALAGLVTGATFFSKRAYAPSFVLRVVEPERDPIEALPPRRQLAEYLRTAVFTSAPLLDVIRRHGLYPALAKKNPRAALDSFREDIDLEVFQNYFVEQRPVGGAPRSARVRVSYRNANPDTAVSVTRELAALVVQHERSVQGEQAADRAEVAREDAARARDSLAARRAEVALEESQIAASRAARPDQEVALVALAGSLPALEQRQDEAERREASLDLAAALERHGAGTSYEVVDDATLTNASDVRHKRFALAFAWIACGLPLTTMAVGAFAPKKGIA